MPLRSTHMPPAASRCAATSKGRSSCSRPAPLCRKVVRERPCCLLAALLLLLVAATVAAAACKQLTPHAPSCTALCRHSKLPQQLLFIWHALCRKVVRDGPCCLLAAAACTQLQAKGLLVATKGLRTQFGEVGALEHTKTAVTTWYETVGVPLCMHVQCAGARQLRQPGPCG